MGVGGGLTIRTGPVGNRLVYMGGAYSENKAVVEKDDVSMGRCGRERGFWSEREEDEDTVGRIVCEVDRPGRSGATSGRLGMRPGALPRALTGIGGSGLLGLRGVTFIGEGCFVRGLD